LDEFLIQRSVLERDELVIASLKAGVRKKSMKQKSFLRFLGFQSGDLLHFRLPKRGKECFDKLSMNGNFLADSNLSSFVPTLSKDSGRVFPRPAKIQNPKWTTVVVLAVAFVLCGAVAEAQQTGKMFRIGFLDTSNASGMAVLVDAFRQELSKLGWIEGKDIAIEYRFAEQKNQRLPELAADLVRLKVDLIVVTAGASALAAKGATTTIPIVMANVGDPIGQGLVASLARPGGNVTGLSSLGELSTKRLEILKDAIPKLGRVGLLRSSGGTVALDLQLKELRAAAPALKLKLEEIDTEYDAKSLESAFQTAKRKQVGAIMTTATRSFFAARKRIVELANKYRLPAIYFQREFVDEGGLMSYGTDFADLYRRAAVYVDKILKGAKPADLPVQQATQFEFIINLKAAKQIGLTLPPELLARANQVLK
jgi:putative ABC transport system substrate-binding protein